MSWPGRITSSGSSSVAGIVTVPLGGTTKFGSWNVHFGAEYQKLGTTTEFFNGGEKTRGSSRAGSGSRTEPSRPGPTNSSGRHGMACSAWPGQRACVALAVAVGVVGSPLVAQAQSADPNPGALTLTGGVDVVNAYYFRGIPQDETGVITWPYADLGLTVYSGSGILRAVTANVGLWNSLHTGDAGSSGPTAKLWYESDFYATVGSNLAGGIGVSATFTAYTSPNGLFATVKEVSVKAAFDDTSALGRFAARPYAVVAVELEGGQADAGRRPGRYLELGATPGLTVPGVAVSVPVRVGLSLSHYYEGFARDERYGFTSVAAIATRTLGERSRFGSLNLHGGVEFLWLGERNQTFGATDVVGSIGVGFSY